MAAGQRKAKGRPKAAETAGPLALTGWVLFDWATQPFYTLVVTFLFAPYFVNGVHQGSGARRHAVGPMPPAAPN